MLKRILTCCLITALYGVGYAQDMHYWTNQFGTRASLLGGAVVGGIGDNTAMYYNPAALTFLDSSSISINANLYQIEDIRLKNGAGDKKDIAGVRIATVPLMVGGRIRTKSKVLSFGYGVITPVDFSFSTVVRSDSRYNIVDDQESPGDEEYIAQLNIKSYLRETLVIFALSWKLNENTSVGLSNIFGNRDHTYLKSITARMLLNTGSTDLVSFNDIRSMSYSHISYSPKLGFNHRKDNWSYGVTMTIPAFKIWGLGSVQGDISGNNIDLFGDGRIDFLGNERQEDLKTKFKYPLSVSAGVTYSGIKYRTVFSAQYFTGHNAYAILKPAATPFLRPGSEFPGETSDKYLQVMYASKPVLNAAIGIEYLKSEKLIYSASFRTDFSAYDKKVDDYTGINAYTASWDIYHVVGGITMKRGPHNLSLGMNIGIGMDSKFDQRANFDNPIESEFLQSKLGVAKASYFALGLLFGYSYQFAGTKK